MSEQAPIKFSFTGNDGTKKIKFVPPSLVEQFKNEYPNAQQEEGAPNLFGGDNTENNIYQPGKHKSSVKQTEQSPTEINQSQDNQENNTESNLATGFSGQLSDSAKNVLKNQFKHSDFNSIKPAELESITESLSNEYGSASKERQAEIDNLLNEFDSFDTYLRNNTIDVKPSVRIDANGPYYVDGQGYRIKEEDLSVDQKLNLVDSAPKKPIPPKTSKQKNFETRTKDKNYINNAIYVDITDEEKEELSTQDDFNLDATIDGKDSTIKYIDSDGDGIPDRRAISKEEWDYFHLEGVHKRDASTKKNKERIEKITSSDLTTNYETWSQGESGTVRDLKNKYEHFGFEFEEAVVGFNFVKVRVKGTDEWHRFQLGSTTPLLTPLADQSLKNFNKYIKDNIDVNNIDIEKYNETFQDDVAIDEMLEKFEEETSSDVENSLDAITKIQKRKLTDTTDGEFTFSEKEKKETQWQLERKYREKDLQDFYDVNVIGMNENDIEEEIKRLEKSYDPDSVNKIEQYKQLLDQYNTMKSEFFDGETMTEEKHDEVFTSIIEQKALAKYIESKGEDFKYDENPSSPDYNKDDIYNSSEFKELVREEIDNAKWIENEKQTIESNYNFNLNQLETKRQSNSITEEEYNKQKEELKKEHDALIKDLDSQYWDQYKQLSKDNIEQQKFDEYLLKNFKDIGPETRKDIEVRINERLTEKENLILHKQEDDEIAKEKANILNDHLKIVFEEKKEIEKSIEEAYVNSGIDADEKYEEVVEDIIKEGGFMSQEEVDKKIKQIVEKSNLPSQEEYDNGRNQIISKFDIPNEQEIKNKKAKIESKYDLTSKSGINAANAEWNKYVKYITNQENLANNALTKYNNDYNKLLEKANTEIESFVNNQTKKNKSVSSKISKYRNEQISAREKFNELYEPLDIQRQNLMQDNDNYIKKLKHYYNESLELNKEILDLQDDMPFEQLIKSEAIRTYKKNSLLGVTIAFSDWIYDSAIGAGTWMVDSKNAFIEEVSLGNEDTEQLLRNIWSLTPTGMMMTPFEKGNTKEGTILSYLLGKGLESLPWNQHSLTEGRGEYMSLAEIQWGRHEEEMDRIWGSKTRRPPKMEDIGDDIYEAYMKGGISAVLKSSVMSDIGEYTGHMLVDQAPILATIAATGGWALPIISGMSGSQKYYSLKKEKLLFHETGGLYGYDHSFANMSTNAIITGAAEGILEFTTARIMGGTGNIVTGVLKQVAKKGVSETAKTAVKQGFIRSVFSALKVPVKAGGLMIWEQSSEAIAEAGTALAENFADIYVTKTKDPSQIYDGMGEAAINGALLAGVLQSPRLATVALKPFTSQQTNQEVGRIAMEMQDISDKIAELTSGEYIKKEDEKKVQDLTAQYQSLVEKVNGMVEQDIKRVDLLHDSEKKVLIEISKRDYKDVQEIQKIKKDKDLDPAERNKKIKELQDKIKTRAQRKQSIIDKYPPNVVDKEYDNRVSTMKQMLKLAEKMGGPVSNIIELTSKEYKKRLKEFEKKDRGMTESKIEETVSQNENYIEGLNNVVKDADDVINNKKSTKAEIKKAEELKSVAEAEIKEAEVQVDKGMNILDNNSSGVMQPRFDANGNISNIDILINKDAVTTNGLFNTAAHEFIHAVFANTLKSDPAARRKLGVSLQEILSGSGVTFKPGKMAEFNKRVALYESDKQGEEMMAIASEMMLNGDIKFNDGVIQKLKNFWRRFARVKFNRDIEFNTNKDVENFLRDYHYNIKNNKVSKAMSRMLAKGANGKMFEGAKRPEDSKREQEFSLSVKKNLQSNPDLKSEFDGLVQNEDASSKHKDHNEFKVSPEFLEGWNKITESKLLDGLIQQGMTELGLPPGALKDFTRQVKEKIGLRYLENFDLNKNDSLFGWLTGVSGGAGRSIIYRAKGDVMKQYVKEGKAQDVSIDKTIGESGTIADIIQADKDNLIDQIENADMSPAARNELSNDIKGLKMVMDLLGLPESTKKAVTDAVVEANVPITIMTDGIQVQDLTYKNIRDLLLDTDGKATTEKKITPTGPLFGVLNAIAAEFGVDPLRILAKQDLNAEQRKAAQMFILNKAINSDGSFNKDIIEALPEGTDVSGKSTGVANTKLGEFYDKGKRAKMKAGATAAGLATQTKRTDITKEGFLNLFGINSDGSLQPGTKADGAIRELIVQMAQLSANQSIRIEAAKNKVESSSAIAKLAEGKSESMFSESDAGINKINETVFEIQESTKLTPAKLFQQIGISDPLAAIKALNKGEFVWTGKLKDQAIEVIGEYIKRDPRLYYVFRDSMAFGMKRSTFGLKKIFESLAPKGNFEKVFNRFDYKNKNGKLNKARIFKKDGKFYFKLKGGEVVSYKEFSTMQEGQLESLYNILDVTADLGPTKSWFLKYFIGDSSSNMNGLIRTSAKLIGVPINSDGSIDYNTPIREEHMFPQNNVGRALIRAFLISNGNPFTAMKIVSAAYGQLPLRMKHDDMVDDAGYKTSMPGFFWEVIAPKIADGSLDYLPAGLASIVRYTRSDIDLNGYQLFEGQTITEFFGVNVKDFDKLSKKDQNRIIKKQNKLIEEILAGKDKKEAKVEINKELKKSEITVKIEEVLPEVQSQVNNQISKIEGDSKMAESKIPIKVKGMSVFDFDDTLGYTKSGVRVTMPNPDGKPKPKRKVVFLAGGAGSGKGNVIKKLGLENQGFKIVNSDISLEWLKENSGLPSDMRDLTKEQRSVLGKLGAQARKIAKGKMMKYQGNAEGVVVDGTGGSVKSMQKLVDEFKDKGYDVSMVFVGTSLETAIERNRNRKERSLLDTIVKRNHESVQNNKSTFKDMFGDRFMEVNTDNLTQQSAMPPSLVEQMNDFVSGYEKTRIDATEFAEQGDKLLRDGAEFDFSEFDKVVEGRPGPLLGKAIERAKKYGTKDMFVLTARTPKAAEAIQKFLQSQGLNIPLKNITGLANSTGDAKAQWMLDKFTEGYNDMYFADDALQNVDAVKDVLNQLDIKSDVVQAKAEKVNKIVDTSNSMESKINEPDSNDPNRRDPIDKEFNDMIERKKGVDSNKIISEAEAKKRGSQPNIIRFLKSLYIPPSAEDFKGLLYYFVGKGKQGDADLKWFKEKLFDPFAKGIRSWNAYKQNMVSEYKALKKKFPEISKSLNKLIPGTVFTNDTAIRVYLFIKAGHNVPGLSNAQQRQLVDHVANDPELRAFADGLSIISRSKDGYPAPTDNWAVSSIPGDMNNLVNKIGRKQFLQEWVNMKNTIFSKDNLNKIEAIYGKWFREALDNILYRMENGGNRVTSTDSTVNAFTEWINGSVGAVMFFNMRSALLQTISTVNFINWSDNNIFKASAAFANQPQFWKDFVTLFNSDQLKQRRKGLQTDVSASELQKTFAEGGATPRAVINYLLQIGFTPTQIADSFAIAFGGASFFRNRFKKYKKEGMTDAQAKEQAMLDFQEIAEETQQSSREDLISQQQASVLGRIVLAFQNVTMQMGRLTKKAITDLRYGRGDWKTNVSKIVYYAAVQNIIFAALQTALAAIMWGDDEEEIKNRTDRTVNQALDSFLRGTGLYGALVSTLKNTIIQWHLQKEKSYGQRDKWKIVKEMLGLSPPIGSKIRKIVNAFDTELYNKGVGKKIGFRIENPEIQKWASIIEAVTNLPLARVVNKANNLEEAITGNHLTWQKIMLLMGWNRWDVGVKDEELEKAKEEVKEERKEKKKIEKEKKKEEKKKEKEEKIKKEEEEKKEKGIKKVRCSGIRSNGERCSNTTETSAKSWKCVHHKTFVDGSDTDGDGKKEYRCTATKSNGQRCKNKTENTNKKCYAHQ